MKGDVEMLPAGPVERILEPEAMLNKAMTMEEDGIQTYNKAALECGDDADSGSKQLFEGASPARSFSAAAMRSARRRLFTKMRVD